LTSNGWGLPELITLDQLRSRPGYLADDSLVIRAEVRVML